MKNDSPSFYYPLLVWFITVLIGPFILVFAEGIGNGFKSDGVSIGIPFLFIIMIASIVPAIPSLILFWLCYVKIRAMSLTVLKKKTLLSMIGIAFIFLTYLIIDSNFLLQGDIGQILWPTSYAITLVTAIFLVKMKAPVIDHS